MSGFQIGYGFLTGGTGAVFKTDKYNADVVTAINCIFDRVSSFKDENTNLTTYTAANDIGMGIDASGERSVDTYNLTAYCTSLPSLLNFNGKRR